MTGGEVGGGLLEEERLRAHSPSIRRSSLNEKSVSRPTIWSRIRWASNCWGLKRFVDKTVYMVIHDLLQV